MTFLRIGVACAVMNPEGAILLVQRGDLGVWNLPSGRLDKGETLESAAVREVREETGLEVEIQYPTGMYYYHGWQRLNVMYIARVVGGELRQQTRETRASAFFAPEQLPDNRVDHQMIADAAAHERHLFQVDFAPDELKRLKRRFAWRWLRNLVSGHPEPRHPRFTVHASLAILDNNDQVLTLPHSEDKGRILPGIECNGTSPPWEQIRKYVRDHYDMYEMRHSLLRWFGLFQDAAGGRIEFIFATRLTPESPLTLPALEWTPALSSSWWYGYRPFIKHLMLEKSDKVLTLHQLPEEKKHEFD